MTVSTKPVTVARDNNVMDIMSVTGVSRSENIYLYDSWSGRSLVQILQPHHTKGVKSGTSSSLGYARIKGVVLGR